MSITYLDDAVKHLRRDKQMAGIIKKVGEFVPARCSLVSTSRC